MGWAKPLLDGQPWGEQLSQELVLSGGCGTVLVGVPSWPETWRGSVLLTPPAQRLVHSEAQ